MSGAASFMAGDDIFGQLLGTAKGKGPKAKDAANVLGLAFGIPGLGDLGEGIRGSLGAGGRETSHHGPGSQSFWKAQLQELMSIGSEEAKALARRYKQYQTPEAGDPYPSIPESEMAAVRSGSVGVPFWVKLLLIVTGLGLLVWVVVRLFGRN